jgi:hypothetical protein
MSHRLTTLAAVTLLMAATTAATVSMMGHRHRAAAPGPALLHAYGARAALPAGSAGRAKLDGTLAELAEHAARVDGTALRTDLRSMNPAARYRLSADGSTLLVAIDAVTRGPVETLKNALVALGLEHPAVFKNDVGGWLPVSALQAAAERADVHSLRAALSRTRTGAVTSQGDFVQNSAKLRTGSALSGAGVGVGVLSDSYDCYSVYAAPGSGVPVSGYAGYAFNGFTATAAADITTGDLPSTVKVLAEAPCLNYGAPIFPPLGDEGRAMLQIVHDVAPGASLSFYTAENSEADFASGIVALATGGAKIIADDVGYFDEPFYQDGIVAQAIDQVEAAGVVYFSAAGNDADASYENLSPSFATLAAAGSSNAGEYLLNFDTTGATTATSLPVTIDALEPGQFLAIIVEWDQPYVTGAPSSGGATSQIDVCVTGATSEYTILDYANNPATCSGANALHSDPYQVLVIANPASATANTPLTTLNLVVGLAGGTTAPGRVKVVIATDGQSDPPITTFATHSPTLQGHPGAAGAAAVAAAFYFQTPACGTTPAVLESFSSLGGDPILFDVNGVRKTTPELRQRPNFTGPDGGNDTFLGFTLASAGITGSNGQLNTTITACQNDAGYPNFFGTSAATPHLAAIAALMLEANSALTPTQIVDAMQSTAIPVGSAAAPNYASGYGFVQADLAFAALPAAAPPAPSLTLGTTTLTTGGSTTLTWSSVNATSCTASGSWSGSQAVSGSQTLTPSATGTDTYSLTCANAAGASPVATATLTVLAPVDTPAPSSHGGGGLDGAGLAGLAALLAARAYRARRVRLTKSPSAVFHA